MLKNQLEQSSEKLEELEIELNNSSRRFEAQLAYFRRGIEEMLLQEISNKKDSSSDQYFAELRETIAHNHQILSEIKSDLQLSSSPYTIRDASYQVDQTSTPTPSPETEISKPEEADDIILEQTTASPYWLVPCYQKQPEPLYWLYLDPELEISEANYTTIRHFFKGGIDEDWGKNWKLRQPALVIKCQGNPPQWKRAKLGELAVI